MSISGALANAVSGLTAASRAAQVVGSNVSNAMTEGYAPRSVMLSSRASGAGGGVQIDGIERRIDEALLRDRRLADAEFGEASELRKFAAKALDILGVPGEPGALSGFADRFETALHAAAAKPDSEARLAALLDAAWSLAGALNEADGAVQGVREDADAAIAAEVTRLNAALVQIDDLNADILRATATGHGLPALLDQRQRVIDGIAETLPVRRIDRDNGTVALYSLTGAALVDAGPATFEFERTEPITADMTLASGALSGLKLDGRSISTDGEASPVAGGRLSALFEIRDARAPGLQDALDTVARDLISRFEDTSVDPTLLAGEAGLFTDGGGPLDPADVVGLAGRLDIDPRAVPAEGGALWRLRDGLGSAAPGAPGDATILSALSAALITRRVPVGGGFGPAGRGFHDLVADLGARAGQERIAADSRSLFAETRRDALRDSELAQGVDTDAEMQKLLLIEQMYAANAQVVRIADALIRQLLEI